MIEPIRRPARPGCYYRPAVQGTASLAKSRQYGLGLNLQAQFGQNYCCDQKHYDYLSRA